MSVPNDEDRRVLSRLRELPPDMDLEPGTPQRVVRVARRRQKVRRGAAAGVTAVVLVGGGYTVTSALIDPPSSITAAPASAPENAASGDAALPGSLSADQGGPVSVRARRHSGALPASPASDGSCPARYVAKDGGAVPETSVVAGASRALVPATVPVSGVLCDYLAPAAGENAAGETGGRLRRDLSLDRPSLEALAGELSRAPAGSIAPCDPATRRDVLILLTYEKGRHWVYVPYQPGGAGECVGATNGAYTSSAAVGERVEAAFRLGAWPVSPPF